MDGTHALPLAYLSFTSISISISIFDYFSFDLFRSFPGEGQVVVQMPSHPDNEKRKKEKKERSLPVLKKSILVGTCVEDVERFRSHPRIFFHRLCTNGRDIAGHIECKEQVSTRSRDIK